MSPYWVIIFTNWSINWTIWRPSWGYWARRGTIGWPQFSSPLCSSLPTFVGCCHRYSCHFSRPLPGWFPSLVQTCCWTTTIAPIRGRTWKKRENHNCFSQHFSLNNFRKIVLQFPHNRSLMLRRGSIVKRWPNSWYLLLRYYDDTVSRRFAMKNSY